jgi:hypothetical protein
MNNKIIELIEGKINNLVGFEFNSMNLMQRGVADYIENLCCQRVSELKTDILIINEANSVRSIEDVEIEYSGNTYKIDIKTHDINRDFSMPNLISIDRARKFLSDLNNHIVYIFIDYTIDDSTVYIIGAKVQPIESLDWSYLAIQNLGKGQLQIKNMSDGLFFNDDVDKQVWLNKLIEEGEKYYEKLILKVSEYKNNWIKK